MGGQVVGPVAESLGELFGELMALFARLPEKGEDHPFGYFAGVLQEAILGHGGACDHRSPVARLPELAEQHGRIFRTGDEDQQVRIALKGRGHEFFSTAGRGRKPRTEAEMRLRREPPLPHLHEQLAGEQFPIVFGGR